MTNFFFSSRRRHTRWTGDWSSDVCSSDLLTAQQPHNNVVRVSLQALAAVLGGCQSLHTNSWDEALSLPSEEAARLALRTRSEERRVGKECRSRGSPDE